MSELEDRLNAVLSDPAELERITRMASQLMGQMSPAPASGGSTGGGGSDPFSGVLQQMLRGLSEPGNKKPLLDGLMPYLDGGRAAKLSRALRTASVVSLAIKAFSAMGGEHGL